ncbi:ATP-binding protein [Onishia taeanensis]|nr:ATP-binding protein [Halomonas taeanensis]
MAITMQSLFSRRYRVATVAAVIFFFLLLFAGGVIFQRHQTLQNRLDENLTWASYQFDREVREFRLSIGGVGAFDLDDVMLRFDILFSRVRLFKYGEIGKEIRAMDGLPELVSKAYSLIESMDDRLASLPDSATSLSEDLLYHLRQESVSLQDISSRILLDVSDEVVATRAHQQRGLLRLYALVIALALLLLVSGGVLVHALIREGRARGEKAWLLQRQTHELNEVAMLAQEASRAKSEFMAIMSHEVRTPLNGVIGMADLLSDEPMSARGCNYLMALKQSADGLQAVINDVLDYTKMESGPLELDQQPFDLKNFLAQLCAGYQLRCNCPSLTFNYHIDDSVPQYVSGDVNRLRQVLMNLCNNAMKFTQEGAITLSVMAGAGSSIRFEVRDTGCGIAPEDQARLFTPFTQVDASISRRHEGTGLGLAICQRLVTAMGGTIHVESQLDIGSKFWFDVVLPEVPRSDTEKRSDLNELSLLRHKILVVEDNPINQTLVEAMLEQMGQDVVVVDNGAAALMRMEEEAFDLVLMDMQMPVLDGLETTRRWRSRENGKHLPIIAMTANVMPAALESCFRSGMDNVLSKPFTREAMLTMLSKYLERASTMPAAEAASEARDVDKEAPLNGDLLDASICEELRYTLDPVALEGLMRTYLMRLEARLEDLQDYLDAGNRQALEREAHSLRGASAALGFVAIAKVAGGLEEAPPDTSREELQCQLDALRSLKDGAYEALMEANLLSA